MRKSLAIIAITAACSIPAATAHADAQVAASVDCSTFTIEITGLVEGDAVRVGEGSQPPYGFDVGGHTSFQFAVDETAGTAATALPIGSYERLHSFEASVAVNDVELFRQLVDCTPITEPVAPVAPVAVESPVVAAQVTVPKVGVWADVELAPPW